MKYNELEVTSGPMTFVFVTRGKAKPFTHLEALSYLDKRNPSLPQDPKEVVPASHVGSTFDSFLEEEGILEAAEAAAKERLKGVSTWTVPDDKGRKSMFRRDLMEGLGFCCMKYGQSAEVIMSEAARLGVSSLVNNNVS
jgi:hypothetical protein